MTLVVKPWCKTWYVMSWHCVHTSVWSWHGNEPILRSTVCLIWIGLDICPLHVRSSRMLAVSRKLAASRDRSIWGWAQCCQMIRTISNLSSSSANWANHCQFEHNNGNRTYWVEMWAELCTARLSRQVTDYVQYKWSEQSDAISWLDMSRTLHMSWYQFCSVEQNCDR